MASRKTTPPFYCDVSTTHKFSKPPFLSKNQGTLEHYCDFNDLVRNITEQLEHYSVINYLT